ncbi:MAG: sigma-70 family RNA polymerase sigma factor [Elusimicrobiota bacterium]
MTVQDPDQELVERAKRGDTQAFGALVERYQRLLTALAFGMLRDEGKTEDVVQEAFISAWKSLPGFRGAAKFRNWLCRILLNKARSALRWGRLRRWISLDEPSGEKERALEGRLTDESAEADPEGSSLREEHGRAVRDAVAAMPLRQRTAVLLRSGGLDVSEVAEAMGLAEGTVKAHLHQARLRLEKVLGGR